MAKIKNYFRYSKYKLLDEIEDCFLYITDSFKRTKNSYISEMESGEYTLYINEAYEDNNYYFYLKLGEAKTLPLGFSNDIESLSNTSFYNDMKNVLHRLHLIKDLKFVFFYYSNIPPGEYDADSHIEIKMIVNDNHRYSERLKRENELSKNGFEISDTYIGIKLNSYNIYVENNIEPKVKPLTICDKNWNELAGLTIDERGFNFLHFDGILHQTILDVSTPLKNFVKLLMSEHKKIKLSDKAYGTYGINGSEKDGTKYLYATDFLLWLKNNGF
jgi:hypothetical protein